MVIGSPAEAGAVAASVPVAVPVAAAGAVLLAPQPLSKAPAQVEIASKGKNLVNMRFLRGIKSEKLRVKIVGLQNARVADPPSTR